MSKYVELYDIKYIDNMNQIKNAYLRIYANENNSLFDVLKKYDSSAVKIISAFCD